MKWVIINYLFIEKTSNVVKCLKCQFDTHTHFSLSRNKVVMHSYMLALGNSYNRNSQMASQCSHPGQASMSSLLVAVTFLSPVSGCLETVPSLLLA
jgi:hypothetical protein